MLPSVKLRLSQDEFYVLDNACMAAYAAGQAVVLRPHLGLSAVLLGEWCRRTERQFAIWTRRVSTKEYAYSMPISTAIATQNALLLSCPNHAGQTLLVKLDQALVNLGYRAETTEQL